LSEKTYLINLKNSRPVDRRVDRYPEEEKSRSSQGPAVAFEQAEKRSISIPTRVLSGGLNKPTFRKAPPRSERRGKKTGPRNRGPSLIKPTPNPKKPPKPPNPPKTPPKTQTKTPPKLRKKRGASSLKETTHVIEEEDAGKGKLGGREGEKGGKRLVVAVREAIPPIHP